jgi:hypothetical protein
MNMNIFMLSMAAMVNAASGNDIVLLGTASNYVILSKSGISTVPTSVITGDIAVSPIAATAITGFTLTLDSSTYYSTSDQVTGIVKAADYTSPTSSDLTTAVSDMEIAYTDAAGRSTTGGSSFLNLGEGDIGGKTLGPGVYTFDRDVTITSDIYFKGTSTDVFIIQTSKSVKQAPNTKVYLTGNCGGSIALAQNIFWSVAQEVIVEPNSTMQGVLLVKTGVTIKTGSTLNGRILAQTAVVLQQATITEKPTTPNMVPSEDSYPSIMPSTQPSSIPSNQPTTSTQPTLCV